MGKYSRDELKQMSQTALEAKRRRDVRWMHLLLELSIKLGMDPKVVEAKIKSLAKSS